MTPDPIARERYLKKLDDEYFMENLMESQIKNLEVVRKIPISETSTTFAPVTEITTTTSSEDSNEDYGDLDIDVGLKPACLAALCFGK